MPGPITRLMAAAGRLFLRSAVDQATASERAELREKIKIYSNNYNLLSPFLDNLTNETSEIRDYYRVMLAEPTVKAAFFGKVWAVASLELRILPAGKGQADRDIADFIHHCLTRCKGGSRSIIESMLYGGLIDGFSISEKVKRIEERGRYKNRLTLQELKPKDASKSRIQLQTDVYGNVTRIRANTNNAGTFFDPKDFVLFTYLPLFGNLMGMSDFRASYRAATLKLAAIKLRMIALDKYSGPYLKGKFTSPEVKTYLETALSKARGEGYIVIPEGCEVDVMDLATTATTDFKAAIDDFDKEIVIGLNGAFLQMLEGQTADGRGNTQVHKSVSELFQWYLAALAEDAMNDQIIPELVDCNFGTGYDLPRASLGGINAGDVLNELQIDEKLHNMGVPLSLEDIYERSDRIPPKSETDKLPGAAAPGAGGSPVVPFRG